MIRGLLFVAIAMRDLLSLAMLATIRFYQLAISPWLPKACRYRPTCSQYALLAIRQDGPFVGGWKTVKRIGRCHPWAAGGWDPP